MKEIEVVVDLRPSPDSPQLILVKQKLAAEGDRLMLVGDPHEERVELGGPRVQIKVTARADHRTGLVTTAIVSNVGMSPVELSRVAAVFEAEKSLPPDGQRSRGTMLYTYEPLEPVNGPLYPGHTRIYCLPMSLFDIVRYEAKRRPTSEYWVAAFVGDDEVGRCPGGYLYPFLERGTIQYERRAEIAIDSLPVEERFLIFKGLYEFVSQDHLLESQGRLQIVDPEKKVYLVKVTPRYRAVVTRSEGTVVVKDIISEESLKQYKHSEKAGGPQG